MGDGDAHRLPGFVARGEQGLAVLHAQRHDPADIFQARIPHQRARQQPDLRQDLEPVANAEGRHPVLGAFRHLAHDRRIASHGAGAQIVAVGESARHDDEIELRHFGFPMPDHRRRMAGGVSERDGRVAVAVRSGKDDDRGFHGGVRSSIESG